MVQVALALLLLICSGLLVRTFCALANVSAGFADPATIENFRIYVHETTIPDKESERVLRMQQAIADKLASISNVSSVAFSSEIPMDNHYSTISFSRRTAPIVKANPAHPPLHLLLSQLLLHHGYPARRRP